MLAFLGIFVQTLAFHLVPASRETEVLSNVEPVNNRHLSEVLADKWPGMDPYKFPLFYRNWPSEIQ